MTHPQAAPTHPLSMTQKLRALYQQLPTNYSSLSTAWLTTFSCILTMLESYCASYPGMLAEVVSASPDPISETDDLLAYTQAMQPYQVAKHALHAEMKHRYNSTTDSAQRTLLILAMHHSKENSFSCACDDEEYEWLVGETDL